MTSHHTTARIYVQQWEGSDLNKWDKSLAPYANAYSLGAQIMQLIAPEHHGPSITIKPTLHHINEQFPTDDIMSKEIMLDTISKMQQQVPKLQTQRLVVLGGDSSASVYPLTYLNSIYENTALIWLDAHPDLNLPQDEYQGFHAMTLSACLGYGDEQILNKLPSKFEAQKVCVVGIRDWGNPQNAPLIKQRAQDFGFNTISSDEYHQAPTPTQLIKDFLTSTQAQHVVIHLDLDVLEPSECFAAMAYAQNGLKLQEIVDIIQTAHEHCNLVGLSITEYFPRIASKLQKMLQKLPLL